MKKLLREWIHLLFEPDGVPKRIVFRVDAGGIYGLSFGHLARCLVLAKVLREVYASNITFLMRDYPDGIAYAKESGQRVQVLPVEVKKENEKTFIIPCIEQFQADTLIVDLPYQDIDMSYFSGLRKGGIRIIFLDDARYINPDVDVILNSSILALQKTKRTTDSSIRYLLGPDYFIFDDAQIFKTKEKNRKTRGILPLNVLITFGGSDPAGLTTKTVTVLSQQYWPGVVFRIILGPGYQDVNQVKQIVKKAKNKFDILCQPFDIYPYFLECDFAICAGGRTLYELQAFGVPTFAIASIRHEIPVIQAFLERGLILAGLTLWDEYDFRGQFKEQILSMVTGEGLDYSDSF